MAYFSREGVRIIRQTYRDCLSTVDGAFHESESFAKAKMNDFLKEVIDRGFSVQGLEIYKGWMEIHNQDDINIATSELQANSLS